MTRISERIGFVGAGNMAEALAGALVSTGLVDLERLLVADLDAGRLKHMEETYGVKSDAAAGVFDRSDVVVIAVKPKDVPGVLEEFVKQPAYPPGQKKLLISIAAGVRLADMEKILYAGLSGNQAGMVPLVRVMPNTPALVCAGMAGLSPNRHATVHDTRLAREILAATGEVCDFDEDLMDAVTAVSGSGPAYVFYLAEAMIQGALEVGLSEADARKLVLATVIGAARLLEARGEGPAELRRKVTSPGGTTEAAVKVLDEAGVKDILGRAIKAARDRSRELAP
ncbi:MAG: pyrroline-5-carboxylate reductase, partial [Pseudomonadota bacterium]